MKPGGTLYTVSSQTEKSKPSQPWKDISVKSVLHANSLSGSGHETETSSLDQPYDPPAPSENVENVLQKHPPHLPFSLLSFQQRILMEIYNEIGDNLGAEFRLRSAPRCIIDAAIEKRKNYYKYTHTFGVMEINNTPLDEDLI